MARTFWMRLYAWTYWVLVAIFAYVSAIFILPELDNPQVASFLPIFVVFIALFVLVAIAASFWRSAPVRPWFWLVGLVPAVLFLLMNAPYFPYSLTHPAEARGFSASLPIIVATVIVVVAGWRSFREARAREGAAAPTSRTATALTAVVAATLGALATGFLASAAGGAAATEGAVTSTTIVEARDIRFLQESLTASAGETLGVVVVNRDSFAHSFDIDALGVHVQLPANASTLVAVTPTAAGTLDFYCAIPGHESVMKGVITVQ